MCGFLIQITDRKLRSTIGVSHSNSLRGDDGYNRIELVVNGYEVILEHWLLAVTGISQTIQQPLISDNHILLFNGQIHNRKECSKLLSLRGVSGCESDTILISELIRIFGAIEAIKMLKGAFAISILDQKSGMIVFASDTVGEKQLYFRETDDGGLVVSTSCFSIDVVDSDESDREILNRSVELFGADFNDYRYCCMPSVMASGRIYVSTVGEGEWFRYAEMVSTSQDCPYTFSSSVFSSLLQRSVVSCIPQERSWGLLLSSGFDSNLILKSIESLRASDQLNERFLIFSLGQVAGKTCQEIEFVRDRVTNQGLEERLVEINLTEEELTKYRHDFDLAQKPESVDGFNLYCCLRKIKDISDIRVVLSGIGGDEITQGYPSFQRNFFNRNWIKPEIIIWIIDKFHLPRPLAYLISLLTPRICYFLLRAHGYTTEKFVCFVRLILKSDEWQSMPDDLNATMESFFICEKCCCEMRMRFQDCWLWISAVRC